MRSAPLATDWTTQRQITRRGVLWLGLTCDVRCKFCYDEKVSLNAKAWMPPTEARAAIDKFRYFYHNEFVDFMGGEPTLHPNALEIVRHAADIGLRPTMITHGMHLADMDNARAFADAGIHDFLVSIHGIGDTVREIHGRGRDNYAKQIAALNNLRELGVPFRFNVTMIKDNLTELEAIAELAGQTGARVVNFLTFNPYFEWTADPEISFQARHSEIAPHLARAIDRCTALGVEANVRYMPPCQLPGHEAHVYTGYQLPYDPHEWDYNSWYDTGHEGEPDPAWYLDASRRQQQRHHYVHAPACDDCALRQVCDGFHEQYVTRWGADEARPYDKPLIDDPTHFVKQQRKIRYTGTGEHREGADAEALASTRLPVGDDGRAGVKRQRPSRS
ncbi:radical SAM protein [Micromonospora gifhornensis]|uniref:Radical SAM protein n=1 Tax=Micromonospora gifhornensis TaxID=84594 RepID=A0ABQ4IKU5_9ACTN|nr:radical SAM protein [Micromonospora gifhornensis]GIJ18525.1 radical SAM protein [Micromonospora gifhornensis]